MSVYSLYGKRSPSCHRQKKDQVRGIVTKSDRHFFPGLKSLLRSIIIHAPNLPVTVLDCGLTPSQQHFCRSIGCELKVVDVTNFQIEWTAAKEKFTRTIYAFIIAGAELYPLTLHLDADTLVLGSLDKIFIAAEEHGIAAIADHPPLTLGSQIGEEGALEEVRYLIPNLDEQSWAFNAGVLAIRREYYVRRMAEMVGNLIPLHSKLWGNDQALLNLAAYYANPSQPFWDLGYQFNSRPRYRRDPRAPKLRAALGKGKGPMLIGKGGLVKVLHFINRPKPWEIDYPRPCVGYDAWAWFNDDRQWELSNFR